MANYINPLVAGLTFVAAMGGGALGAAVTRVAPVSPDLSSLHMAIEELQQSMAEQEPKRTLVQPPAPEARRRPVIEAERSALPEIEELRGLVTELRRFVETMPGADPPPVGELRAARATDSEAVWGAVRHRHEGGRTAGDDLMFLPFHEVLARFGRPSSINEDGGWVYRGRLHKENDPWYVTRGLIFMFREGHVVSIRER